MKSEQLESLIIDQALGELPPDVSELLDLYLQDHPERRVDADHTLNAVDMTRQVIQNHPEGILDQQGDTERSIPDISSLAGRLRASQALKTLAAAALIMFVALGGFLVGKRQPNLISDTHTTAPEQSESQSPWARYELEADGQILVLAASKYRN
ncbi:MAG: hypothetical protein AAF591_07090 [Verrucomicrobiota bacterium]